jgi:hypothetical protein
MKNINEIDISKRCGIKPENTIYDFLEKVTTISFRKTMKKVIAWKNDTNPNFRKHGLDAEIRYTPYLKSKLKDIPEDVLKNYSSGWCTDGKNIYIYNHCCR